MKKKLLFLLIAIISLNCYAQINFEKGYFINNENQKVNCFIKNIDWKNNPIEFEYKLSENQETKRITINSVKEFQIYNYAKYIRAIVNIDRSSESINYLSEKRNPIFKKEKLFLKVLVEGKSNLYEYKDTGLIRFFYSKDDSTIEQLVFKSYRKVGENIRDQVAKNNRFRTQLWNDLKCVNIKVDLFEKLIYKRKELTDLFIEYNNCNNSNYSSYGEKEEEKDLFNLNLRPRFNNSSLSIQNSVTSSRDTDFGSKIGFGFGVETEFILPFNQNKWSVIIEPTYQSFKSKKTTNVNNVSGGQLIANVNYNSIEVPIGIRHYIFLNEKSKFFANASFIFDASAGSSIEFTRNDGSILETLDIKTGNNLALGIGYKQNDKYSLELRYQTSRTVLGDYLFWDSDYSTLSVIFGYSLF